MRGEWGRWQSEDSTTSRAGTRQAAEQAVAGCSCRVARIEAHKAIDIGSFLFGKDQIGHLGPMCAANSVPTARGKIPVAILGISAYSPRNLRVFSVISVISA